MKYEGGYLGVTATREGLTQHQRIKFKLLVVEWSIAQLHSGDCVGGDTELHNIICNLMEGYPDSDLKRSCLTFGHPPDNNKYRAFNTYNLCFPPLPYLERNKAIVDATDHLIVCPKGKKEYKHSGTWSTKKYAESVGKPYTIIYPDGTTSYRD